jgi:hypothetical protein
LTDPNDRRYIRNDERYVVDDNAEPAYPESDYVDPDDQEPEPPDWPDRPPPRRRTITPLRVTLGIALLVSLGVVGYGLVARDATQVPVLTAGEFISGVVFGLLALAGAWASYSRSREGSPGRALVYAVMGGIAALLAAAWLSAATIQTLILGS